MKIVQDVIKADGQITLLEWTVYTVLEKHLGERFDAASRKQPGTESIRSLSDDVRQVLATAAYLGQDSLGDVRAAYSGVQPVRTQARRPVAGGEALHPADTALPLTSSARSGMPIDEVAQGDQGVHRP